jgi:putative acetyltransferase
MAIGDDQVIRRERFGDEAAIREVVAAAFGRRGEADLVDRLRDAGDAVIALVALHAGEIVGYAVWSRMTAPFRALGLGPVAVRPDRQRRGVGSALIRAGLEQAREAGWQAVFVLGDPAYYRRFGFDAPAAAGFTSRYAGPHFMALTLGTALPAAGGILEYAPAFTLLD